MPVDPEIMADVRRANEGSRWGGQLNPRAMGAEHVTTALNRYSLRRLGGHGFSKDVSLLGIGSKKRDSEQLQLESLFAEFQQLKIEKEQLERDDVPSFAEKCSAPAKGRRPHDWTSGAVSGNVVPWDSETDDVMRPGPRPDYCTRPEPEPEPEPGRRKMTADDAMQPSVVDEFGELLRQHSMTPAQRRQALPMPENVRSASVDLPIRRAVGRYVDSKAVSVVSKKSITRNGRDSVDHWLRSELALADSEAKSRRQSKSDPMAEPIPSVVHLEVRPMTKWLQSLGLEAYTPQMLSMLPKLAVDTMNDQADCQFYFEDLVRTKQGLMEVRSLCKACRMLAAEEAKLLRAVRAAATAYHIPNHEHIASVRNTQAPKPGRAAREAIKRRSVTAETQSREASPIRSRLARSNRAADLRAKKSHSVTPSGVAEAVAVDRNAISVRYGAPFSSVLLEELSAIEGTSSDTRGANSTTRVDKMLRSVEEHSNLASGVLENGRQLLQLQQLRRKREAERAAAEAVTRKRIVEQNLTDLQINM